MTMTTGATLIGTERAAPPRNGSVPTPPRTLRLQHAATRTTAGFTDPMTHLNKPREYLIQGKTLDGQAFRPSDWAERLAGAMACFRPEGVQGGIAAFIGYSPYCVPRVVDGVKCVIVSDALQGIEPMAWDFVMSFAKDNRLQLTEASPLPAARCPEVALNAIETCPGNAKGLAVRALCIERTRSASPSGLAAALIRLRQ